MLQPEITPMTPAQRAAVVEALADTQTEYGSSRWAEYRRCQWAHHLRYVEGYSPKDVALHFGVGRLVHAAHAYVQIGVMLADAGTLDPAAPRDWRHVIELAGDDPTCSPEAQESAWRLLRAYFAHYGDANAGWGDRYEIAGVEVPLETQIGGLPYTARADTLLRDLTDGTLVIGDTKTRKSSLPKDPELLARKQATMRTRPQFAGLVWLVWNDPQFLGGMSLRDFGDPPPRLLVNAIVKTQLVQFQRLELTYDADMLLRWFSDQQDAGLDGLYGMRPNWSECAPDFGGECWAYALCHEREDSKTKQLYTIRKKP